MSLFASTFVGASGDPFTVIPGVGGRESATRGAESRGGTVPEAPALLFASLLADEITDGFADVDAAELGLPSDATDVEGEDALASLILGALNTRVLGAPTEGATETAGIAAEVEGAAPTGAGSDTDAVTPMTTAALPPDPDRLHPELRARLERVMERMRAEYGHEVKIAEGYRTQERQAQLFAQGRTAPGPVVTWTRTSAHTDGLAVDVVIDGTYENPIAYERFARLAREEGLVSLAPLDPGHVELEGEDVGTRFLNNQWEGRLEAHHREFGPSRGAMGLQFSSRDFEAIGEEAFVPRSETTQFGFFAFEEMDLDAARVQLGARFERQRSTERADDTERVHNGLSLSAGLNVPVGERLTLALSASRSVKMPTPEELYSNGPHLATSSFEVGNPDLDTETALSLDASARLTMGRVQGGLTGFVNAFNGFIFPRFTGVEVDGLQEVVYSQADARYVGFELDGNIELYHVGAQHLALLFGADYVRATLTETDQPLPRIPPLSLRGGFEFDAGPLRAGLEARHVARQDRVAAFETETDGYTLLDGSVSYRLIQGAVAHDLTLSASNLTDEEARVHTSLLKDLAPMPGREVRLAYRLSF